MVELAIALSLQEQGEGVDLANLQHGLQGFQGLQQLANLGGAGGFAGLQGLQGIAGMLGGAVEEPEAPPVGHHPQAGNYSDGGTASAPGSDDEEEEGSTAALDGSALRTPPAEAVGDGGPGSGAGSESGASANESIVGEQTISGRSSAYGEGGAASSTTSTSGVPRLPTAGTSGNQEISEWEVTNAKLHSLRLILLDQLVTFMPGLRNIGGVRCVPYMQVNHLLIDIDSKSISDVSLGHSYADYRFGRV